MGTFEKSISFLIYFILVPGVVLGTVGYWTWMLVDCIINEPPRLKKALWIFIIVAFPPAGAVAYHVFRRGSNRQS